MSIAIEASQSHIHTNLIFKQKQTKTNKKKIELFFSFLKASYKRLKQSLILLTNFSTCHFFFQRNQKNKPKQLQRVVVNIKKRKRRLAETY